VREEEDGVLIAPDLADEALSGLDGVKAEGALEGLGCVLDVLEDVWGNFHERGATAGYEAGAKAEAIAVHGVESAAVAIEDADEILDDEAVEIVRAEVRGEGLAKGVEEIEDARFFELKLRAGAVCLDEASAEDAVTDDEEAATAKEQEEKNEGPCH